MARTSDQPVEPNTAGLASSGFAEAPVAPDEPESAEVTLVAHLPFYMQRFNVPQEDGSVLSFDKHGTRVPTGDADRLIQSAADNGVSLTREAN